MKVVPMIKLIGFSPSSTIADAPSRIIKNHKCCYNLHYVRGVYICKIKSLKEEWKEVIKRKYITFEKKAIYLDINFKMKRYWSIFLKLKFAIKAH